MSAPPEEALHLRVSAAPGGQRDGGDDGGGGGGGGGTLPRTRSVSGARTRTISSGRGNVPRTRSARTMSGSDRSDRLRPSARAADDSGRAAGFGRPASRSPERSGRTLSSTASSSSRAPTTRAPTTNEKTANFGSSLRRRRQSALTIQKLVRSRSDRSAPAAHSASGDGGDGGGGGGSGGGGGGGDGGLGLGSGGGGSGRKAARYKQDILDRFSGRVIKALSGGDSGGSASSRERSSSGRDGRGASVSGRPGEPAPLTLSAALDPTRAIVTCLDAGEQQEIHRQLVVQQRQGAKGSARGAPGSSSMGKARGGAAALDMRETARYLFRQLREHGNGWDELQALLEALGHITLVVELEHARQEAALRMSRAPGEGAADEDSKRAAAAWKSMHSNKKGDSNRSGFLSAGRADHGSESIGYVTASALKVVPKRKFSSQNWAQAALTAAAAAEQAWKAARAAADAVAVAEAAALHAQTVACDLAEGEEFARAAAERTASQRQQQRKRAESSYFQELFGGRDAQLAMFAAVGIANSAAAAAALAAHDAQVAVDRAATKQASEAAAAQAAAQAAAHALALQRTFMIRITRRHLLLAWDAFVERITLWNKGKEKLRDHAHARRLTHLTSAQDVWEYTKPKAEGTKQQAKRSDSDAFFLAPDLSLASLSAMEVVEEGGSEEDNLGASPAAPVKKARRPTTIISADMARVMSGRLEAKRDEKGGVTTTARLRKRQSRVDLHGRGGASPAAPAGHEKHLVVRPGYVRGVANRFDSLFGGVVAKRESALQAHEASALRFFLLRVVLPAQEGGASEASAQSDNDAAGSANPRANLFAAIRSRSAGVVDAAGVAKRLHATMGINRLAVACEARGDGGDGATSWVAAVHSSDNESHNVLPVKDRLDGAFGGVKHGGAIEVEVTRFTSWDDVVLELLLAALRAGKATLGEAGPEHAAALAAMVLDPHGGADVDEHPAPAGLDKLDGAVLAALAEQALEKGLLEHLTADALLDSARKADGRRAGGSSAATNAPAAHGAAVANAAADLGWTQLFDTDSGKQYYWHEGTGETRWEAPAEAVEAVTTAASGASSGLVEDVLAAGWTKCWSPEEGSFYYWNEETNEVAWQAPLVGGGGGGSAELDDWVEQVHEASGQMFWYSASRKESRWDPPTPTPSVNGDADAADGWEELRDDATGGVYYFNEATGETAWEKPAPAGAAATAAASGEEDGGGRSSLLASIRGVRGGADGEGSNQLPVSPVLSPRPAPDAERATRSPVLVPKSAATSRRVSVSGMPMLGSWKLDDSSPLQSDIAAVAVAEEDTAPDAPDGGDWTQGWDSENTCAVWNRTDGEHAGEQSYVAPHVEEDGAQHVKMDASFVPGVAAAVSNFDESAESSSAEGTDLATAIRAVRAMSILPSQEPETLAAMFEASDPAESKRASFGAPSGDRFARGLAALLRRLLADAQDTAASGDVEAQAETAERARDVLLCVANIAFTSPDARRVLCELCAAPATSLTIALKHMARTANAGLRAIGNMSTDDANVAPLVECGATVAMVQCVRFYNDTSATQGQLSADARDVLEVSLQVVANLASLEQDDPVSARDPVSGVVVGHFKSARQALLHQDAMSAVLEVAEAFPTFASLCMESVDALTNLAFDPKVAGVMAHNERVLKVLLDVLRSKTFAYHADVVLSAARALAGVLRHATLPTGHRGDDGFDARGWLGRNGAVKVVARLLDEAHALVAAEEKAALAMGRAPTSQGSAVHFMDRMLLLMAQISESKTSARAVAVECSAVVGRVVRKHMGEAYLVRVFFRLMAQLAVTVDNAKWAGRHKLVKALVDSAHWHIHADGGAAKANIAFSLENVESMATGALQAIEAMGLGGAAWADVVLEAGGEAFVEGLKDGFCERAASAGYTDGGDDETELLMAAVERVHTAARHTMLAVRAARTVRLLSTDIDVSDSCYCHHHRCCCCCCSCCCCCCSCV